MSGRSNQFPVAEAVILIRQGGQTMAVHVPNLHLMLTPIVNEPVITEQIGFYAGPAVTGYDIEAAGVADRLTIWQGADPFAKDELEQTRAAVES